MSTTTVSRHGSGATHVVSHPRLRRRDDGRRVHRIDYRHVIHALRRKPQALAGSVYRDGLFPRTEYADLGRALGGLAPAGGLPAHGRAALACP